MMAFFKISFLVVVVAVSYSSNKANLRKTVIEIGTVSKYYPRYYVTPNRKLAKYYGLNKDKKIPRYLNTELYMVIVVLLFCPIYFLIILFAEKIFAGNEIGFATDKLVLAILLCVIIHLMIETVITIHFFVNTLIWQRAAKKEMREFRKKSRKAKC